MRKSPTQPKKVCLLGSTGSIGRSTLDVISRNQDKFKVAVLAANQSVDLMFEQCLAFKPELVVMQDPQAAQSLSQKLAELNLSIEVNSGNTAMVEAVKWPGVNIVVAAIVGAAGLLPTLEAVKQGHKVLLANKEALVMSGKLMMDAAKEYGATLLPVDSEHNAIFQSIAKTDQHGFACLDGINKILLTGSGGPFRTMDLEKLPSVTPAQACAHPNWSMGKKISVDSATMMNKGLEYIEACFLFNVLPAQLEIVIHPQSVVHSMVAFTDGSVIAQMGMPDMRTPIAHALAWPERIQSGVKALDFYQMQDLTFSAPDYHRFPCLLLAQEALCAGGTAPAILNAANEVAVDAFLNSTIAFTQIHQVIKQTLEMLATSDADTLEKIINADSSARQIASNLIGKMTQEKAKLGA